jgi:hypothetical protein
MLIAFVKSWVARHPYSGGNAIDRRRRGLRRLAGFCLFYVKCRCSGWKFMRRRQLNRGHTDHPESDSAMKTPLIELKRRVPGFGTFDTI